MARPRGAMASALRRIPDLQRLNSAALAGHARLFIHPAYARLVNSEPYVKRLIPILIVLFVVALGGMRGVALYQAHAEVAGERRAAAVADRQGGRQRARASRAAAVADRAVGNAAGPAGERAAAARHRPRPPDPASWTRRAWSSPRRRASRRLVGRYIDEILGPSQPLTTLGERAGVLQLDARLRRGRDRHRASQSRRRRRDRRAAADVGRLRRMAAHGVARGDRVRGDQHRARHPRLRLSRADGARAGSGLHLFGDADPLPHGAPARPFGPVGMGSVARRDLLVAVDVRDSRARAAEPAALGRRGRRAHPSRRRRPRRRSPTS